MNRLFYLIVGTAIGFVLSNVAFTYITSNSTDVLIESLTNCKNQKSQLISEYKSNISQIESIVNSILKSKKRNYKK
jgi:hypothetical protein